MATPMVAAMAPIAFSVSVEMNKPMAARANRATQT